MTDPIADFTVRDDLWEPGTRIFNIGRRRHSVQFADRDEANTLTFCNNCSESFTIETAGGMVVCGSCGIED